MRSQDTLPSKKKKGIGACVSRKSALFIALLSPLALASPDIPHLVDLPLEDLLKIEVVSASRFVQLTTEAPATVSVIEENELRQHGYRNLAEALVTLPGIYSSYDRNYTYLGTRGFNRPGDYGTRTLLLTDGSRRNDPLFDQAFVGNDSPIELDWVKRLEFVPGPASAVYGSNALFGTINTIMLDGRDINGWQASVDAGSQNSKRVNLMSGQKLDNGHEWFLGVAAYRSGGENLYFPEYNNGSTSNGQANGLDGERYQKLYAKYRLGNWQLAGNMSSRTKDLPTAPWETLFGESGTWTKDQNGLLELRYSGEDYQGWQPSARFYRGHYRYDGSYRYDSSLDSKDRAAADWYGSELHMAYSGIDRHKLMFGLDTQRNSRIQQIYYETAANNILLDTNNPSSLVSISVLDEWRFAPDWRLNLSLRHDKHSDFAGETSPRAALIWQATPRLNLKAIVGQAYRFPNAYERYYHDGNVTQSANPDLKPEQIRSKELAASYQWGAGASAGISVYDNVIHNLIDQVTDSAGVASYTNLSKVRAHGIEISAEKRWDTGLHLRGSVSWQQSKREDGSLLDDSPQRLGKLIAGVPVSQGWTASGELFAASSRTGTNGPVPGYGVVNLKMLSPKNKNLGQISLSVYNLTNRRYYSPANNYLLQHSIEQPRRHVMLRYTHGQ